jgi:hypothetical protein
VVNGQGKGLELLILGGVWSQQAPQRHYLGTKRQAKRAGKSFIISS